MLNNYELRSEPHATEVSERVRYYFMRRSPNPA